MVTKVLLLASLDLEESVRADIFAGAIGYLPKGSKVQEIVGGVHAAYDGNTVSPKSVCRLLWREPVTPQDEIDLSVRETDVLRLLCYGHSNEEISKTYFFLFLLLKPIFLQLWQNLERCHD